ncbi:MAG: T9SS type A sorting domain-containing protein [Bacteroidales bacterium]|nr:T9SS type A sorting domain-containing protein [Bacteroidales bacterium]
MRRTLLFITLIALHLSTNAQTVHYAQRATGNQLDEGNGIAVDNSGNTYITGQFESATLNFGTVTITNNSTAGDEDAFVAKFDASGNCVWAKSIGGSAKEYGSAIALDNIGNIFVAGYFESSSFTLGSQTLNNTGDRDGFAVMFNNNGDVQWAKSMGGNYDDEATSISSDGNGNVYVIGYFWSSTLSFGSQSVTSHGDVDIFTAKYNSSGTLEWAKAIGGTGDDRGRGIVADALGNHIITGGYESSSVNFGSATLTNSNTYEDYLFVAKYDNTGTNLWAKHAWSAAAGTEGSCVSLDQNGNCYVGGTFDGTTAQFGSYTITNNKPGGSNAFIAKYNATGVEQWASNPVSGPEGNQVYCISTDNDGYSYISGWFTSPSVTFGSIVLNSSAYGDNIFLARYNPAGQATHAYAFKGTGFSGGYGNAICNDNNGNVFLTGYFEGSNMTFGTTTLTNTGSYDVYWTKVSAGASGLYEPDASPTLLAYPNPFSISTILEFGYPIKNADLYLYNNLGEVVRKYISLSGRNININKDDLGEGLYYFHLVENDSFYTGKLIVK